MRHRAGLLAFALVIAACSSTDATQTTEPTTTTTVTTVPITAGTTRATFATTSTTEPADTTTTTSTTTTMAGPTTTLPLGPIDANLDQWAGLYRQPTAFPGFLELRGDGILRAGPAFDNLPWLGLWEYNDPSNTVTFRDFDPGTDCAGAEGRYTRSRASGGGFTLTLDEDPCDGRVAFMTQVGSSCSCLTWLEVDPPVEEEATEG